MGLQSVSSKVGTRNARVRWLGALLTCLGLALIFAPSAWATHNRATQLTWSKGIGAGEVNFTIQFVARRSYYAGPPNVGDVIADPFLDFGDGQGETPSLVVIAVDGDTIYTEGHVSHTYSGNGPFTATMGSCCRLQPSSGHINNSELSYSVHTLVDFVRASSSPQVSVAPIVFCHTDAVCSFAFASNGADPGNHLRWRFSTPSEAGDISFVQPGPPQAPNAATIDPVQGRYRWDTTGATVNGPGLPSYYSTQIVVEEVNSQEETVSEAAADFFIALGETQTQQQPDCEDTDSNGSVDNDGDGLCDNWEESGIDGDDDGNVDVVLPGANLNQPDVYTEIDYMEGRKPQSQALAQVAKAFAAHGIALHPEVDDEVPFFDWVKFDSPCSPCGATTTNFDDVKSAFFGTFAERNSSNLPAIEQARKFAYHYVLYANELLGAPTGTSGVAELPGNDFTVTLGNPFWRTGPGGVNPPTLRTEAGTFMHELGHNLGLYHGGGDSVNCKPNYISIMNYTRQTAGVVPSAELDYSESALPTLDETNLNELVGLQGPAGVAVAYGPGPKRILGASGPIDWDWSGVLQNGVAADANYMSDVPGCEQQTPGEDLAGFDDWDHLSLPFQATSDFSDGVHSTIFFQEPEASSEDLISEDSDEDGVPNIQDSCPTETGAAADGCPASPDTSGSSGPPPSASPGPAGGATSAGSIKKPPKCKHGYRRKTVKKKTKCVKVKKHHRHRNHRH